MSVHVSMRGRDGDNELEEAIAQIDMEGWLDAEGIDYKVGRGHSGVQINLKECPLCGHDKWKTYLNAESGLGKCFVCEQGLNKWKIINGFTPGMDGRSTVEHIKSYAKTQGWVAKRKTAVAVNLESDLIIPESVALPVGKRNLAYLDNRNITGAYSEYFGFRFCVRGGFKYLDQHGKRKIQSYDSRVIIPVFDMQGELVSFQGRDITGKADLKYLFPPGFASTGAHLYNGQNAIGAKRIAVGEGAFDVAAIKIAIDKDMALRDIVPVGTFGKSLSFGDEDSQMAKLMYLRDKGLEEVIFLWDGEAKTILAAIEAALRVRSMNLIARVAILPTDKDPNEVPESVVQDAIWKSTVITPASAVALKMKYSILASSKSKGSLLR